jgi:hypothetical protein
MRNYPRSHFWFSFFAFSVLIYSCHTAKKTASSVPANRSADSTFAQALELYKKNIPQFSALTIKGNIEYSSGNSDASFGIHLRIKKDSAIWISASPLLGIEAVRMLITPDSVKILDRLNNIYYSDNLEALKISFHADVNIDVLQSLICASYITSSLQDTLRSLYVENPDYVLSTVEKKNDNRAGEHTSELPFACDLWCTNPTMRVNRMVLSEPKSLRKVEAQYEDYRESDVGMFPYQSTITAKDSATQKTAMLKISVSKITSSPDVEIPFSVPKKFEHRRLVNENR